MRRTPAPPPRPSNPDQRPPDTTSGGRFRTRRGWEPTVFRISATATLTLGAAAGAAALVWGEDLRMTGWAQAIAALVALAALTAITAAGAAYQRQRRLIQAEERQRAMRRHPSTAYDYKKDAR